MTHQPSLTNYALVTIYPGHSSCIKRFGALSFLFLSSPPPPAMPRKNPKHLKVSNSHLHTCRQNSLRHSPTLASILLPHTNPHMSTLARAPSHTQVFKWSKESDNAICNCTPKPFHQIQPFPSLITLQASVIRVFVNGCRRVHAGAAVSVS